MNSISRLAEETFAGAMTSVNILRPLCEFMDKYPLNGDSGHITEPAYVDETFQEALKTICSTLCSMKLSFDSDSGSLKTILLYASQVLTHMTNADNCKPFDLMDYQLYLKLAIVVERLKIVLFYSDYELSNPVVFDKYFNIQVQQYLVKTYKSKLGIFKSSRKELKYVNLLFTTFLMEYIVLVSNSSDSELRGELSLKNIELLFEIGDLNYLMTKFFRISHIVPITKKFSILKKFIKLCIKNSYPMDKNELLTSDDNNFKDELIILSYYTLQHMCELLELENLNQSMQLLSKTPIDFINSANNSGSEDLNVDYELILQAYTSIQAVPSTEIKNCLSLLENLLSSLEKYGLKWCGSQFGIVLLSLLFEFVMATDLDKSCITSLIDITMGVICELPVNFQAGSYAFKIYQKLKSDSDLDIKSKQLFKKMCIENRKQYNAKLFCISDFEQLLSSGEDLIDVSAVVSRFLDPSVTKEDKILDNLFYTFNECVIVASHNTPINSQMIFPFSVSLYRSLETKNNDCLFNNLAVLDNYLNFVLDTNQIIHMDDRKAFIRVLLKYYKDIEHCLPNEFLTKCCELLISPSIMDFDMLKDLLKEHSSTTFYTFVEILKIETIKFIEGKDSYSKLKYCMLLVQLWSYLLNLQTLTNKTKKIRKDLVNHFCFTLNRTFLFHEDKVPTEIGLIVLMQLVSALLQVSWININTLMNCSLRIITFVEKKKNISNYEILTEAAELLIVLYKCKNNSIKPYLGLYMITFSNVVMRCCKAAKESTLTQQRYLDAPFHKLIKCASLFKENKNDFIFIIRCILVPLIDKITANSGIPEHLTSYGRNIIHNLMQVCPDDEVQQLAIYASQPTTNTLSDVYRDYILNFRFNGRL